MKLISLNIEGGAQGKTFFKYIKARAKTADLFCFQEVFASKKSIIVESGERTNVYGELKLVLKDFNSLYFPVSTKVG
jgi:exonuclease III